jgi:hypothetical protein
LSFAADDGLDASVVVAGALSSAGGEIFGVDEVADVIGSLSDDVVEVAVSAAFTPQADEPPGAPKVPPGPAVAAPAAASL